MVTLSRLAAIVLIAASAAACASTQPPPVKQVEIKTVVEKIPVPCQPELPPTPQYADTADALKAAGDIYQKVKLLLIGREQRQGREKVLEAALKACAAPIDNAKP
ncbi:hypothetical protein AS593_04210 [Caulobacter vibrioides]|nr:hypothetical protein AS593_04210 [Caulobacter vibrioides]